MFFVLYYMINFCVHVYLRKYIVFSQGIVYIYPKDLHLNFYLALLYCCLIFVHLTCFTKNGVLKSIISIFLLLVSLTKEIGDFWFYLLHRYSELSYLHCGMWFFYEVSFSDTLSFLEGQGLGIYFVCF